MKPGTDSKNNNIEIGAGMVNVHPPTATIDVIGNRISYQECMQERRSEEELDPGTHAVKGYSTGCTVLSVLYGTVRYYCTEYRYGKGRGNCRSP